MALVSAWCICLPPPTLHRCCYLWKDVILSPYCWFICENIFILLLFSIFIFFKYLFGYKTLFTYTTKNFVLIIGIIFSVVSDKQRLSLFTTSWWLCTFDSKCHQTDTTFIHRICGKINKIQLCFLCCRVCRGEDNLWFGFKFEIFYLGSEVSMVHLKITVAT